MLRLIAALVIVFIGWLLSQASGYVIGFRGGRPLLERPGRIQKLRLKTIDRGEKLFGGLPGSERERPWACFWNQ